MSTLALIVARGGSKRVPRKNCRSFHGKPLIYYTINESKKSAIFKDIVVSTDDLEIAEISKEFGAKVPFMRPKELSGDKSEASDVVEHALNCLPNYDRVMLLQPSSPLRRSDHIIGASKAFKENAESLVSFCEVAPQQNWLYLYESLQASIKPMVQDTAIGKRPYKFSDNAVLIPNGAIYLFQTRWFHKKKRFIDNNTIPYLMDKTHSIDIDTEEDWFIASELFEGKKYD